MKDPASLPELTLERYRLGELSEAEARSVSEALEANLALHERLAAIERSDQEILDAEPPQQFAASVQGRLRDAVTRESLTRTGSWKMALAWGLSLTVIATGALLWRNGPRGRSQVSDAIPGGERLKGLGPSLLLFRKADDRPIERLVPGALAHARDLVQVAYQAGGSRYGVILSIDSRGVVTRHFPASGDQAGRLQPNGPSALRSAYRLDDAPKVERFYFIASDDPFALPPVEAAVRSATLDPLQVERLPLDARFAQVSFLLRKE